ncbi:MAG: hypothetical protein WD025_01815 [Bacteriovoracaceae bacterium]
MRLFAICCLFICSNTYAANIVGRVLEIEGNAFAFDSDGRSKQLGFGSRIYDLSEVMVDDSSRVSVIDSSENVHHLSGGTYAKFFNKLLEIKNGHVWTVAKGESPAMINTVNSVVYFNQGQFITSVNNADLKTQVLALTGEPKLASSLEPGLSIVVPAGHFSFIDQDYEQGLPRNPTRVGLNSYQKIKTVFSGVEGLKNESFEKSLLERPSSIAKNIAKRHVSKREIASVEKAPKRGKTIYIKTYSGKRKPASVNAKSSGKSPEKKLSAMDYYKEVSQTEKKTKKKTAPNSARSRYFGFQFEQAKKSSSPNRAAPTQARAKTQGEEGNIVIRTITEAEVQDKAARLPASTAPIDIVDDINSSFEKSLKNKLKNNQRHSNEVNELIDELKSFNQDYSKHY